MKQEPNESASELVLSREIPKPEKKKKKLYTPPTCISLDKR